MNRNHDGVGCRTFTRLSTGYGVSGGLRRCNGDGLRCLTGIPSARSAAANREGSRAALADGLVGSYGSVNIRLNRNGNGVDLVAFAALAAYNNVSGSGIWSYGDCPCGVACIPRMISAAANGERSRLALTDGRVG